MPPSVKNLVLFYKRDNSDCLVCVIKPLIDIGAVFGISAIRVRCPHTAKVDFAHSTRCRLRRSIQFVWIALLLLGIASNCYVTLADKPDVLASLNLVAEILYCSCSVVVISCTIMSTQLRTDEINACISLVEHRLSFGVISIYSQEYIQCARKKAYGFYVFIIALTCLISMYINYSCKNASDNHELEIIRHITAMVSTIVPIVGLYQYSVQCKLFKQLFMMCYKYVANTLIARHNVVSLRQYYDPRVPIFGDVEQHLKRMIKFHKAIFFNLKMVWMNFDPMVLIWFILILAILIINVYLLLVTTYTKVSNNDFIIMLELRTYFVVASTVYFLITFGELSSQVSAIW